MFSTSTSIQDCLPWTRSSPAFWGGPQMAVVAMGNCVSSLQHPCRDQIKSDASSQDVVTKPDTEVFLRAAIFRSMLKTSVPSKQRRAAASSTLMFLLLLARDLLSVVDRDAVLQCRKHVILWRTLRDRTFLTLFSLTPTVCESAARLACPPLCCTPFFLVICHVCPKIPACNYSRVSSGSLRTQHFFVG